jgi:hypothetical protein
LCPALICADTPKCQSQPGRFLCMNPMEGAGRSSQQTQGGSHKDPS